MGNIGPAQLLVIALILLVLFGGSRVAELGKGLGEGLRSFKKGLREDPADKDAIVIPDRDDENAEVRPRRS